MFNDKLVILTYKNTIYQSKFELLAIFVTILVCKQHTMYAVSNRFRTCAVPHTEAELTWLTWIRVAQTQIACDHISPEIFRENHFSVFLAILDEFLLTSVHVWEK
jgi:hypothetical protein